MRRIAVIGNGGGGKFTLARPRPASGYLRVRGCLPFRTHFWWTAKRQVVSLTQRRGWAGQSAPPPSLLLLRTLRRDHALRSDLLDLVTKNGRAAKLVHLRSPLEMTRWLDEVTPTKAEVME